MWRHLWGTPQATVWDESFASTVALYVVHSCAVLGVGATAWRAQEARHLAEALGLTPAGLQARGWRIANPQEEADVLAYFPGAGRSS